MTDFKIAIALCNANIFRFLHRSYLHGYNKEETRS